MSETLDEKTVLVSLQGGSQEAERAMGIIFDYFHARLCIYAIEYVEKRDFAEDVVSDVFLQLWKERQVLKIDTLNAYLYRSTHNTAMNLLKKERRLKKRNEKYANLFETVTLNGYDANNWLYGNSIKEVYKALDKIPPQARQVLQLAFFEGLNNEAIAQRMQLSINTVKHHKFRGILLLRKHLGPEKLLLLLLLFRSFWHLIA